MLDSNVFFWKCHVPEDKTPHPTYVCLLGRHSTIHCIHSPWKLLFRDSAQELQNKSVSNHQSYMLDKGTLWSPFPCAVAAHTGHSQPLLSTIIPVFKIKEEQESVHTPVHLSSQIHESQTRTQTWWGQTTSIAFYLCLSKAWVYLKQETKLRYSRKLKNMCTDSVSHVKQCRPWTLHHPPPFEFLRTGQEISTHWTKPMPIDRIKCIEPKKWPDLFLFVKLVNLCVDFSNFNPTWGILLWIWIHHHVS